jgi:hypothetical protein
MAANVITEAVQNTLRDNFIFYSIIVLLLSQIGSWVTKVVQVIRRIDRKEEVINKIALDLVKLKKDDNPSSFYGIGFPALTLFYNYKLCLTKKRRLPEDYVNWLAHREDELSERIEEFERKIKKLEEEQVNLYEIKESRKIPDSLKKKTGEIIEKLIEAVKSKSVEHIYSAGSYIDQIHNIYAQTHQEKTYKENQNKEQKTE